MVRFRDGEQVTIRHGQCDVPQNRHMPDGPTKPLDVGGIVGTVDGEPYESKSNGKTHVVVRAAPEHGGGIASVPVDRLVKGTAARIGYSATFAEGYDRIFHRRSRRVDDEA